VSETSAERLSVADILRLSTALADQMVRSRASGHSFSDDQLAALVRAARFLHERNVPWPPLVQDVVDMLAAEMEAVRASLHVKAGGQVIPLR
jgi:hypothetical protein